MNKAVKTRELFDCRVSYLAELFDKAEYPWELLPEIGGHGLGGRVVRRHDEKRPLRLNAQSRRQMRAVDGAEPRHQRRQRAPLDGIREGGQVLVFEYRQGQCFHVNYLGRLL